MRVHPALSLSSILVVVGLSAWELPLAAQYQLPSRAKQYESGWENDRVRVRKISVAPGAAMPVQADADRILVYLTADLQNRIPEAEAIWQPAGTGNLENRGRFNVEAIAVELKNASPGDVRITPPEALPVDGMVDARVLIDNPRVIVTRLRYFSNTYAADPWHFHPQDGIIVYLRGGNPWVPYDAWEASRVRRGDIAVLPANTFHSFGNTGGDPLEFLVIFPK